MIYTPHILQKRVISEIANDEYGRPIPPVYEETWVTLCRCRCDYNSDKEFRSDNGSMFRPDYSIVCEGNVQANSGDYVRVIEPRFENWGNCISKADIKGEGSIFSVKRLNFLAYSQIWV